MKLTCLSVLLVACQSAKVSTDGGAADGGGADDAGADGGGAEDGGTDGGGAGGDGGGSDGGSPDGGDLDGGGTDGGSSDGGGDGGTPVLAPDYREAGPYSVGSADGSTDLGDGCTLNWTRFSPSGAPELPTVIFGHGFMRSRAQHVDMATHLASWGLSVVTVDFCHSNVLDADHAQNARDMVLLGEAVATGAVLYAGHSAGGLSAILAGAEDPGAAGVLGLDPVDVSNLGLDAAPDVEVPVLALVGELSSCNSNNNGVAVVTLVPDGEMLRVTDADHCDYESNTDWLCTLTCTGGNDSFSDEEIGRTIRGFSTAALLSLSGGAPEAAQWWTPGETWYVDMLTSGAVRLP